MRHIIPLSASPLPHPICSPPPRSPLSAQDLVLSEDLKGVRRKVPVPEYDIAGMQRRILVVENLPALPTIGERRCRAVGLHDQSLGEGSPAFLPEANHQSGACPPLHQIRGPF